MLETGLRHALERNEFEIHYQPQVDAGSRRIVGMEALLRWRHPDLGYVPTNEVISLLEETGLIEPVGEWILRTACTQVKQWLDAGYEPLRMSVNLSARQFKQADLADRILRILAEVGLDPGLDCLDLELTESMIMEDAEMTLGTLHKLNDIGIKLSIDDFGTGYSSLSYLRRFPIHTLKIDQSFTRDLGNSDDAAAIVAAIIGLAHGLKLDVIAEGVETQQQLDILRGLGSDVYQGYLFSRPVPAGQATELLQSNSGSHWLHARTAVK
jgi:EAL domain-containing protein (putative c-di-GMP-specific phosphodiesterase class I)